MYYLFPKPSLPPRHNDCPLNFAPGIQVLIPTCALLSKNGGHEIIEGALSIFSPPS